VKVKEKMKKLRGGSSLGPSTLAGQVAVVGPLGRPEVNVVGAVAPERGRARKMFVSKKLEQRGREER
jgi:hypothetical protein